MANEVLLIDANALKDDFRRYMADRYDRERCVSEENCIICGRVCLFQRTINNAPTVDAVEVVHGKWTPNFEYDFDRGEHRLTGYHCDKCGIWTLKKSNYCPNCGAKMRGNEE